MAQLDIDLSGVNTAISRLEREIELLREYRTRLIADVVTGKLDVREAAAALPDELAGALKQWGVSRGTDRPIMWTADRIAELLQRMGGEERGDIRPQAFDLGSCL